MSSRGRSAAEEPQRNAAKHNHSRSGVYTENRPYGLVTESPNVIGDGRTILFLAGLERRSLVPHSVVSMVSVGFEGGHDHPARDCPYRKPKRLQPAHRAQSDPRYLSERASELGTPGVGNPPSPAAGRQNQGAVMPNASARSSPKRPGRITEANLPFPRAGQKQLQGQGSRRPH